MARLAAALAEAPGGGGQDAVAGVAERPGIAVGTGLLGDPVPRRHHDPGAVGARVVPGRAAFAAARECTLRRLWRVCIGAPSLISVAGRARTLRQAIVVC